MKTRWVALSGLLSGLCSLAPSPAVEQPLRQTTQNRDDKAEKLFTPVMTLQGTHSQIKVETFEVIRSAGAWKSLWEKHHGEAKDRRFNESHQELTIDFDTHLVVAVFSGPCSWCEITPRQSDEMILIGYRSSGVQTANLQGLGETQSENRRAAREQAEKVSKEKDDAAAPYAFIVLRKPVSSVMIRQDVRGLLADPPVWKDRHAFAGLDLKK